MKTFESLALAAVFLGVVFGKAHTGAAQDYYQSWREFQHICTDSASFQVGSALFANEDDTLAKYGGNLPEAKQAFRQEFREQTAQFVRNAWIESVSGYSRGQGQDLEDAIYNFDFDGRTNEDRDRMRAAREIVDARLEEYMEDFERQNDIDIDILSDYYPVPPVCE